MRRRSYSPSPPRGYGRRGRSPSPRGRYGGHSRDAPTSLLVRNLRHDCRPEDLRRPFGQFGPVKDIYLPRDYYTGSISPEEKRYSRERSYSRSPARDLSPPPHNGSRSRSQTPVREHSPYDDSPRSRSKSPVRRERSLGRGHSRSPSRSRSRSHGGAPYSP